MITIELELPSASLIAAGIGVFTASEATLALVLCVHQYARFTALQIPAGLLGGFSLVSIGLCFAFAAYPTCRALFSVVAGTGFVQFALGVYWLAERLRHFPAIPTLPQVGLECALVALWAFQLLTMAALDTFVLCDRYYTAPHVEPCETPDHEKTSPNPSTESWPETLVVPHTPVASPPKSPKKFSLKRMSPLRKPASAGSHTTTVADAALFRQDQLQYPARAQEIHIQNRSSISAFAIPTGSAPNDSPTIDLGAPWVPGNFKWSVAGSQFRSVSGSSQQSKATSIFAATDYNKKLNDAGFQKDEPVPAPRLQNKHSFSEYDLERMRNVV